MSIKMLIKIKNDLKKFRAAQKAWRQLKAQKAPSAAVKAAWETVGTAYTPYVQFFFGEKSWKAAKKERFSLIEKIDGSAKLLLEFVPGAVQVDVLADDVGGYDELYLPPGRYAAWKKNNRGVFWEHLQDDSVTAEARIVKGGR